MINADGVITSTLTGNTPGKGSIAGQARRGQTMAWIHAMSRAPVESDRADFHSWVKATTFGWWLGFAVVILLVLAVDAVAEVGEGAQFMVGVGMGAGVGYMQGRWMRWLGDRYRWLLASTVGMGTPFAVGDVASAVGLDLQYSLALNVALGSLLAGILQWSILRRHLRQAVWWVPASVVGWMLPVGLIALGDHQILPGVAGESATLVGMFFGGVVLGGVTGGVLSRLLVRAAV